MRETRTAQASIFDLDAQHGLGRELKEMLDQLPELNLTTDPKGLVLDAVVESGNPCDTNRFLHGKKHFTEESRVLLPRIVATLQ